MQELVKPSAVNKFYPCRRCQKEVIPAKSTIIAGIKHCFPTADFCDECKPLQEAECSRQEEERQKAIRKWREDHLEELLERAGVPKRYLQCTMKNYRGKKPDDRPGFITGPPGVGKTHLAVALLRDQIIEEGREAGRFMRTVDLLKEIRNSFQEKSAETELSLLKKYGRDVPFLVIDDLGTEKCTDWVEQTLYDLIDRRYVDMLPTVITSNLSLDEIEAHYIGHGKRLASRICDLGKVFKITGDDKRVVKEKKGNYILDSRKDKK
jgi:DNA replication protein DnaC